MSATITAAPRWDADVEQRAAELVGETVADRDPGIRSLADARRKAGA